VFNGEGTIFKLTPSGDLSTLHSFACSSDGCEAAGVVQGIDGHLYGAANRGGSTGGGTIFRVTLAGAFTVLHSFDCAADGCNPNGGLIQTTDGAFYGTTSLDGGGLNHQGTVFKITPEGAFSPLHAFDCDIGCLPHAGLVHATDGNLYGVTEAGGPLGGGNLFRVTLTGAFTSLHSFQCNGEGTCDVATSLIQASDGNLYGTATLTIFRATLAGAVMTLHSFNGDTEGFLPLPLVEARDGNFYGMTTVRGGVTGAAAFRMTRTGSVTVLHAFACSGSVGCTPVGAFVQAEDGALYAASDFGPSGNGTISKMTLSGTITVVRILGCGTDGCLPFAGLLQTRDGDFYGTTASGGTRLGGTIFKKFDAGGALIPLRSFDCGSSTCLPLEDNPLAAPGMTLIQGSDGNLYGTTQSGGAFGGGMVFSMTPADVFRTMHSFDCRVEGCKPQAGLVQGTDGNFYGTTIARSLVPGSLDFNGTVFMITAAGALVTLHSFDCSAPDGEGGCLPMGSLVQGADGAFYGTTASGGTANNGTVFRITSAGVMTILHSFDCFIDGCDPRGGLVRATDGNFYGTTSFGGSTINGTVFKITPAGVLTTLHFFDCGPDCFAAGALLQGSDGNLYGTTAGFGPPASSLFRVTLEGAFTTLHSFACDTDGCEPTGRLVQGTDGNLYGTASTSCPEGGGTLFRVTIGPGPPSGRAKLWVGLKNSDSVGLRIDLLAEVFVDAIKVGEGEIDDVSPGSSGYNNARLTTIPLRLVDEPEFSLSGSALQLKLSVRRTCTGAGQLAGSVRLWYNGDAVDSGSTRDAGTRFVATIGETSLTYFARPGQTLSTTAGTSRQPIDVAVDSKEACPARAFKPFGTWTSVP